MKTMNLVSPLVLNTRQTGVVLITGLIFLMVLTIIGITAARMASLEERMSGNRRDLDVARQAAEMALRDAERDIQGVGTRTPVIMVSKLTGFSVNCNEDGMAASGDDGLCDRRGGVPTHTNTSITWPAFTIAATGINYPAFTADMTAAPSIAYGAFTGAPAIAGLSAQPRYIIEGFIKSSGGQNYAYYRITARAQGANANTVVWLQEVFKPV